MQPMVVAGIMLVASVDRRCGTKITAVGDSIGLVRVGTGVPACVECKTAASLICMDVQAWCPLRWGCSRCRAAGCRDHPHCTPATKTPCGYVDR